MRGITIAIVLVVISVIVENSESVPLNCQDSAKQCSTNDNCCSGCCQHGKCGRRDACMSTHQQDACAFHQCPQNKECYLMQVQCVTAPCNPVPACRPQDSDYD